MTTTVDRERTRNQLQGLAQLARQVSPDSSGYVDLSAFASGGAPSTAWVDDALAQSRAPGSEPPKIDRLDAESMRPVALESLIDQEEVVGAKTARMQKAFIIASSVCIAGLAVAAIALALRSPDAPVRATHATAAAAPVAVVVEGARASVIAAAEPVVAAAAPAPAEAAPAAAADTKAPVAPQGTPGASKTKRKLVTPSSGSGAARVRTHGGGSSSSASASPLPTSKKASAAANDSLMSAIQQSMAAPPKK